MKILAIADEESKYLWDYFEKSKLEGIDLIISCGDLDPRYLSFLATFTSAPVLYVHGNHDDKYERIPPDGCICIDDKIYVHVTVEAAPLTIMYLMGQSNMEGMCSANTGYQLNKSVACEIGTVYSTMHQLYGAGQRIFQVLIF